MAEFRKLQQQFASYIRDPKSNPAPEGIEERRLNIYRELFFNNVAGFLSNTFPVLKSIVGEKYWSEIARDFYASHACTSPLFSEIPQEFISYLQDERQAHPDDPAFMLELAHYEWIEMAVAISNEDDTMPAVDPNGDLMTSHPVLSPVMHNLSYRFPVHRISIDYQPLQAGDDLTHLVVFRNRQDEVNFLEINEVTQHLIEILKQNPDATGLDAVTMITEALQHPQPDMVKQAGKDLLYELRHKDVIIGTTA